MCRNLSRSWQTGWAGQALPRWQRHQPQTGPACPPGNMLPTIVLCSLAMWWGVGCNTLLLRSYVYSGQVDGLHLVYTLLDQTIRETGEKCILMCDAVCATRHRHSSCHQLLPHISLVFGMFAVWFLFCFCLLSIVTAQLQPKRSWCDTAICV